MADEPKVEVCQLSYGRLLVRLDGDEVCFLPAKKICTIDDLRAMLKRVVSLVWQMALDIDREPEPEGSDEW